MNSLFKIITDSAANANFETISQSLLIEDLELLMSVGIHTEEKQNKQRVMIDLSIDLESNQAGRSDNIKDTVSYADIVEMITEMSQVRHYNLLENFAENIMQNCFDHSPMIKSVSLSIIKPDILDSANVGITMSAERG